MKTIFSFLGTIAILSSSTSAAWAYRNTNNLRNVSGAIPVYPILPGHGRDLNPAVGIIQPGTPLIPGYPILPGHARSLTPAQRIVPGYPLTPSKKVIHAPWSNLTPGKKAYNPINPTFPWLGPHFPNTHPGGPTGNRDEIATEKTSGFNNFILYLDVSELSIKYVDDHYINNKGDNPAYAIYDFVTDAYPAGFSTHMLIKMKGADDPSISTIFQPLANYIGYQNPKKPKLLNYHAGFLKINFDISWLGSIEVNSWQAGPNHRF